ncbi:MAG TPA: hypothetical protein VK138_05810, partial [Acidiferrobacterales bacterium]|nr:hypothetical protein [Acidiferrobacterales bacterium]
MNYKLIGAIVLGLVTTSITGATSTGVPFIFSAGSPARASEVNANFAALQAQIDNLTSGPSFQTVNVTRIDAAVGSQVTIAGQVFTICERIVPNLNSDAQYRVRFPSPLINSSRQCEISSSVAPWDSTISPGPRRAVIDGYIVALVASRFFNIVTLPVNQELSSFTQSISPVIFVEGG